MYLKGKKKQTYFAHIIINPIRNESDMLVKQVSLDVDMPLIAKTKLGNTFTLNQFVLVSRF